MHHPGLPQQTVSLMHSGYNKETIPGLLSGVATLQLSLDGSSSGCSSHHSRVPDPSEQQGFAHVHIKGAFDRFQALAVLKGDQQSRNDSMQRLHRDSSSGSEHQMPTWSFRYGRSESQARPLQRDPNCLEILCRHVYGIGVEGTLKQATELKICKA